MVSGDGVTINGTAFHGQAFYVEGSDCNSGFCRHVWVDGDVLFIQFKVTILNSDVFNQIRSSQIQSAEADITSRNVGSANKGKAFENQIIHISSDCNIGYLRFCAFCIFQSDGFVNDNMLVIQAICKQDGVAGSCVFHSSCKVSVFQTVVYIGNRCRICGAISGYCPLPIAKGSNYQAAVSSGLDSVHRTAGCRTLAIDRNFRTKVVSSAEYQMGSVLICGIVC